MTTLSPLCKECEAISQEARYQLKPLIQVDGADGLIHLFLLVQIRGGEMLSYAAYVGT